MESIIKIKGKLTREPREINNSIELYFNIPIGDKIPKGLRDSKYISYKVIVSKKMWNKLAKENEIYTDTIFNIKGEIKLTVNSEKKPYIIIYCTKINVKNIKETTNEEKINNKPKKYSNWKQIIDKEECIEVDLKDIDVVSDKHKYAVIELGDRIGKDSIIAVSKNENGRYSLIAGFKTYVSAMIYRNNEPIKVYVYNGDRDEFKKEFGIEF